MKTMTYQGYAARIEYSDEDGCFVGHVAGIRDVIGFHGESVAELRAAFDRCRQLRFLGWTFERVMNTRLVRLSLEQSAVAHRRPDQPMQGTLL